MLLPELEEPLLDVLLPDPEELLPDELLPELEEPLLDVLPPDPEELDAPDELLVPAELSAPASVPHAPPEEPQADAHTQTQINPHRWMDRMIASARRECSARAVRV